MSTVVLRPLFTAETVLQRMRLTPVVGTPTDATTRSGRARCCSRSPVAANTGSETRRRSRCRAIARLAPETTPYDVGSVALNTSSWTSQQLFADVEGVIGAERVRRVRVDRERREHRIDRQRQPGVRDEVRRHADFDPAR